MIPGYRRNAQKGPVEQVWKKNDRKAQKHGMCQSVYWVKEKKAKDNATLFPNEKQYKTGDTYKGQWHNNKKSGYGTQIWANGNKYEGGWQSGKQDGNGTFWIKEKKKLRKVYTGVWKNGYIEGQGVYYYKNKDRYEGNWKRGMRQFQGTHFFASGDVYVGEWNEDKQSGFGTLTRANEDVYEGEWLNGKREGPGIYYYKSKEKIYDGEWVNDIPKCGVYCAASEFFEDGDDADDLFGKRMSKRRRPVPRLRLLDPDGILTERIEKIQKDRRTVRNMPYMQLEKLFSAEGLDDLRRIFGEFDPGLSGFIPVKALHDALGELQFQLSDVEIAQLLLDLDKNVDDKISFSEFVKAAHLVDSVISAKEAASQE
jgi:hypothetical protein